MTTQAARKEKLRILDADDLTTGYRVDVTVRTDPARSEWRSLMEREIDYQRFKEPGPDTLSEVVQGAWASIGRNCAKAPQNWPTAPIVGVTTMPASS